MKQAKEDKKHQRHINMGSNFKTTSTAPAMKLENTLTI